MPSNIPLSFRIAGSTGRVSIEGDVCRYVDIRVDSFLSQFPKLPCTRLFDLLHLAVGSYAIDRLMKKKCTVGNKFGSRAISLTVEVADIEFWSQSDIKEKVIGILRFLSDDDWDVVFEKSKSETKGFGYQDKLDIVWPYEPEKIALYSGGLDSAAGLANRLISGADKYLLMTIGHQSSIRKLAQEQVRGLAEILKIQEPLHTFLVAHIRGGKKGRLREQELTQRTRAFLFCACAAISAYVFDIEEVEIFENGIGAINFPPMIGMLMGGLSTRGAHPSFLMEMTSLASLVTERRIKFSLPFLSMTKGEMLAPLKAKGLGEWAKNSKSCVHTSLRIPGKTHCGKCPACIERRQAFFVAEIPDSESYSTDIFGKIERNDKDFPYFAIYKEEAVNWIRKDPRTTRRMNLHLRATEIPQHMDDSVFDLQTRYAQEIFSTFIQDQSSLMEAQS